MERSPKLFKLKLRTTTYWQNCELSDYIKFVSFYVAIAIFIFQFIKFKKLKCVAQFWQFMKLVMFFSQLRQYDQR